MLPISRFSFLEAKKKEEKRWHEVAPHSPTRSSKQARRWRLDPWGAMEVSRSVGQLMGRNSGVALRKCAQI